MSQLLLLRHGQAMPFEDDTDRLSALGEVQAKRLGEALREEGTQPTHVIHGPLKRQRRTAELAQQEGWPDLIQDNRLAEYDGDGLIKYLAPLLAQQDAAFAALHSMFSAQRHTPERNRYFQKMLEPLTDAYLRGELHHPALEPWADFQSRVRAALTAVLAHSGATALLFTSGGVIGSVVASVLRAPAETALALNWRVKNASITRLTYGAGRVSLDSFNEIHHLGRDLQSWR